MRRTNGLGGGEVSGLYVAYRHWGGLDGTSPSKDGAVGAWGTWDESWGEEALSLVSRDIEGLVWPPLMCFMAEMGWEVEVTSSNCWSWDVHWRENWFARWWRVFRNREWGVRIEKRLWRSLNRLFKWPFVFPLIVGISHRDHWNLQGCEMGF